MFGFDSSWQEKVKYVENINGVHYFYYRSSFDKSSVDIILRKMNFQANRNYDLS